MRRACFGGAPYDFPILPFSALGFNSADLGNIVRFKRAGGRLQQSRCRRSARQDRPEHEPFPDERQGDRASGQGRVEQNGDNGKNDRQSQDADKVHWSSKRRGRCHSKPEELQLAGLSSMVRTPAAMLIPTSPSTEIGWSENARPVPPISTLAPAPGPKAASAATPA